MKKIIIINLSILFVAISALAVSLIGSGGCNVFDNFSGNMSKWTELWERTGWTVSGGTLNAPTDWNEYEIVYTACAAGSGDQWVTFKLTWDLFKNTGPIMCSTSDGSGERYWVRIQGDRLRVYLINGDTEGGLIAEYIFSEEEYPVSGNYFGIQVIDSNTVNPQFKYWNFGLNQPSTYGPTAWGVADQTLSHDDDPAIYPTGGEYIGLRISPQGATIAFDDFCGGSD